MFFWERQLKYRLVMVELCMPNSLTGRFNQSHHVTVKAYAMQTMKKGVLRTKYRLCHKNETIRHLFFLIAPLLVLFRLSFTRLSTLVM
jgi:hypothetical protein